jgi:hypothetical protein
MRFWVYAQRCCRCLALMITSEMTLNGNTPTGRVGICITMINSGSDEGAKRISVRDGPISDRYSQCHASFRFQDGI